MSRNLQISTPASASGQVDDLYHELPLAQEHRSAVQTTMQLNQGSLDSSDSDAMSLSDPDSYSEQLASSSKVQNTMSRSTHTPKYLGVVDITTDEEFDPSEILAIRKRIDQIAKVSEGMILSFGASYYILIYLLTFTSTGKL